LVGDPNGAFGRVNYDMTTIPTHAFPFSLRLESYDVGGTFDSRVEVGPLPFTTEEKFKATIACIGFSFFLFLVKACIGFSVFSYHYF